MKVDIFDVEHGACALITADSGARMLIDCGHNSSNDWRPSRHLPSLGISTIDMFVSTNMDHDHVSDLANLRKTVHLVSLLRNPSISSLGLASMKLDGVSAGIEALMSMLGSYTAPVPLTNWGNLSYTAFWNTHGVPFTDTNNLSLVLFVHAFGLHMVFPGDLETDGWLQLLQRPDFRAELARVNVFVASHHGRDNGRCEAVFKYCCSPAIVIMSDKPTIHDTQQTAGWYGGRCSGIVYNGEQRHVFTTRRDGKLTLIATPDGQARIWTANG